MELQEFLAELDEVEQGEKGMLRKVLAAEFVSI